MLCTSVQFSYSFRITRLHVDREGFIEDQTELDRAGELSNIDDYYDTETIDGDTYYIIQIDY